MSKSTASMSPHLHADLQRIDIAKKLSELYEVCKPRAVHKHDCDECKFHGTVEDEDGSAVDVYTCKQMHNIGTTTILTRNSSVPSDNRTIQLREAIEKFYKRAVHGESWRLNDYDVLVEKALTLILTKEKPHA